MCLGSISLFTQSAAPLSAFPLSCASALAVDTCDIRIKAGRRGGGRWIPLNEVLLFSKSGALLRNNTVQAISLSQPSDNGWQALAARCFDGSNATSCFDPNAARGGNVTLVLRFPCTGSALDELDKVVLINTRRVGL